MEVFRAWRSLNGLRCVTTRHPLASCQLADRLFAWGGAACTTTRRGTRCSPRCRGTTPPSSPTARQVILTDCIYQPVFESQLHHKTVNLIF